MMDDKLLDLAKHVAHVAIKAGAKDARSRVLRSRTVRVEWRDGKLDRIRESTKQGFTVSLFVDGRFCEHSNSDIRAESVETFVTQAVQAARHLAPDPHRRLPEPARYQARTRLDLKLSDPGAGSVTPEDRRSLAKRLEEAARTGEGSDRIISVDTSVSDSQSDVAHFSTNGFEAMTTQTVFSRSAGVSIKDHDDRRPNAGSYASARYAADLPPVAQMGQDALARAVGQMGSRQIPTGTYEVIVENRVAPRLARFLVGPLSGAAVQQKRSYLEDLVGKSVASDALTMTDTPHLIKGLGSAAFDSEGMATVSRKVYDRGVLKTFFLDTYYASKLGVEPTTGGASNLVFDRGRRDASAMLASLGQGLYVTDFLGGNSNATTGDFSLGIKGFYIKDGKVVHPVSEMNIAGNHLVFWKNLAEVGSDPWAYSSLLTPTLRFTDVNCSGA